MAVVLDTIVVRFGDSVAADTQFASVFLDSTLNRDDEGNAKTRFFPGDRVYLLAHLEPGLSISRIATTSGDYSILGTVGRSERTRAFFVDTETTVSLSHYPASTIDAVWFGRTASVTSSGREARANNAPVIGDIIYTYNAISIEIIPPPLELADDDEYPLGVVVTVTGGN